MNPNPIQIDVIPQAGPNRLQDRRVRPDLRVAVHARLRGGNSGEGGILDRCVAVPAVEANPANVMGVTELDRLLDDFVLPSHPPGAHQGEDDPSTGQRQGQKGRETHAGGGIGATREKLAHSRLRKRPKAYIDPWLDNRLVSAENEPPIDVRSAALEPKAPRRAHRPGEIPVRLYNVKHFTILSNYATADGRPAVRVLEAPRES